jgi:two-component system, sporulation sensor kinase D
MKDTGTGLGLVVCKRIIEAIDGTIEIDSTVGKGTNVIVTIPIQTEHTES